MPAAWLKWERNWNCYLAYPVSSFDVKNSLSLWFAWSADHQWFCQWSSVSRTPETASDIDGRWYPRGWPGHMEWLEGNLDARFISAGRSGAWWCCSVWSITWGCCWCTWRGAPCPARLVGWNVWGARIAILSELLDKFSNRSAGSAYSSCQDI